MQEHVHEQDMNELIDKRDLNLNTFLQIVLDFNLNIRIHIRVFHESESGSLLTTRQGVCYDSYNLDIFHR